MTAPLQTADGTRVERHKGTPQGGVISPVLSNLFMHYAFDVWMTRTHPDLPWCRYADDGVVHCRTERDALALRAALAARLEECGLQMHPDKTRIVNCKDGSRTGRYPRTQFDFLGYTFRPRLVKNSKRNSLFVSFTPAVSAQACTTMRRTTRRWNLRNRTDLDLPAIATLYNPILRGWMLCRVGGGRAFALPPSARSNGSCGFPASRFPVWSSPLTGDDDPPASPGALRVSSMPAQGLSHCELVRTSAMYSPARRSSTLPHSTGPADAGDRKIQDHGKSIH